MPTLARQLGETTPVSLLIRKARRLGLIDQHSAMSLAAARGCHHYHPQSPDPIHDPGQSNLSDEELTVLLLSGEYPYQPTAIRCAAQLARSPRVQPLTLARLASRHKTHRVLAHIARAGLVHDTEGRRFWQVLLDSLPPTPVRPEPDLPHWTRFVSMPGRQRHGPAPTRWLTPLP